MGQVEVGVANKNWADVLYADKGERMVNAVLVEDGKSASVKTPAHRIRWPGVLLF
jgi:hypothetical protein